MKIAFIGQKGIPAVSGGVERRVEQLSIRMAEMGHEVFVYARRENNQQENEYKGVKLIFLPYIKSKNFGTLSNVFLATIHALFQNYEVIHYQAPGPSTLSWIIRLFKRKTALIATFNSRDQFHSKWGFFARKYLQFGEYVISKIPDKTVAVSPIIQKYVKKEFGEDILVVANGSGVKTTTEKNKLSNWNLEEKKYFLFVGRLLRHKGAHLLIQAFREMKSEGRVPNDFKLVIVGDGSYSDSYVQYLKELSGEDENIVFTGSQFGESLAQLFSHAYAFVQPSETEGLSNALLEAMGCAVPVIVSNIEENVDPIGSIGIVFETGDISDLKEKMSALIKNPQKAQELGNMARERARKHYNWDEAAKKYVEIYKQAIEEKNVYVWNKRRAY